MAELFAVRISDFVPKIVSAFMSALPALLIPKTASSTAKNALAAAAALRPVPPAPSQWFQRRCRLSNPNLIRLLTRCAF